MTESAVATKGVRQLAVLASVAAVVSMAALLVGGVAAGLAGGGRPLALLLACLGFVGFALFSGWQLGLYVGLVLLIIGTATGSSIDLWGRMLIVTCTVTIVHEAARFSFDARKPTRTGAGAVRGATLGVALGLAAAVLAAIAVRQVTDGEPGSVWVPLGLAASAVPLFGVILLSPVDSAAGRRVPFLRRLGNQARAGRGAQVSRNLVVVGVVAVTVAAVTVAALGAQHRWEPRVDEAPATQELDESPVPLPDRDPRLEGQTMSDTIGVLLGMFLAMAVLGLIYGAFHRRQILLVQDDLDLALDDSAFAFSLPDPAELDEAGLDSAEARDLVRELLSDLDAEPDPGRAIRFAYASVEERLAAADLGRRSNETVHEFLERCLPTLGDGAPLVALTDVFERARFSETPTAESARAEARAQLALLETQLVEVAARAREDAEADDVVAEAGDPGVSPQGGLGS